MSRHSDLRSRSGRESQKSSSSSHEPGYSEDDESYLLEQYANYVPKKKKFKRRSNVVIKKAVATIERKERDRAEPSAPSKRDIVKIYFQYDDNDKSTQCLFCNYQISSLNASYLIAHLIGACPGVPLSTRKQFAESINGHKRWFPQQMYRRSSSTTTIELTPASTQDTNGEDDNQVEVDVQKVLEDAIHVKTEKDEDCKIIDYEENHEREMKRIERKKAEAELKKEELEVQIKQEKLELIRAKRAKLDRKK